MNQDEWEELANRREQVHPELAEHLMETPDGLMLDHPLVRELPGFLDPDRAAHLNWRYREKLKLEDEALTSGNWSEVVFLRERPHRVGALIDLADVLPDKEYWALVSGVWTDSENVWQNLDDWRALWNEGRPHKRYAMDVKEQKTFKRLPDEITIYRGICEGHVVNGLSWTLDREKAIWFAKRQTHYKLTPVLLTASAKKSDAHAPLLGRKEDEIVIDQFEIIATECVAWRDHGAAISRKAQHLQSHPLKQMPLRKTVSPHPPAERVDSFRYASRNTKRSRKRKMDQPCSCGAVIQAG